MSSRRASVLSTRSAKQRHYSTDRRQRQAELSIRIEEGRPRRPPQVREDEISTAFVEDFFTKPASTNVTSLTHADTFPCPLDAHPGQRVRGYSTAFEEFSDKEVEFRNPFPEPDEAQQLDIEQRGAIFRRVDTGIDAEEAQRRITRTASEARERANHPFHRVRRLLGLKPALKHGIASGLRHAAGLATSHATAVLSQKPAPLFKRRTIYVLEYDLDEHGVLLCAPPKLCDSVSSLRYYLEDEDAPESLLRLVYICNHEEAINFVSGAYGISSSSAETGERSFRDWMQDDRDVRRASRKAIRWRPAYDIARSVICTAFGLDFGSLVVPTPKAPGSKKPTLSSAVYRQRIAVYMQRACSEALPGPRVTRFNSGTRNLHDMAKRDTIIVSEYSSGEAGEIVSANALLSLSPDTSATIGEDRRAATTRATLQLALSHVFDGLYNLWLDQIALIHEPHAMLEDHIYAHPSDSSRARDIWAMSQRLNNMLKLANRHSKVIEAVQDDFVTFAELDKLSTEELPLERRKWLHAILDDFEVLSENIECDYLEPLQILIDLMYKSVTIRDSKQSLELNASLWRLSWITFIFLPLTFLVGAFGMNVDAFKHDPSIKWYFVAIVPLVG
jgi:Mg2+ and Co2+ transporter CorA